MSQPQRWIPSAVAVLGVALVSAALAGPGEGRLKLVEAEPREDLIATVGVAVSPDGRFVYVATEDHKTISVFERGNAALVRR